MSSMILTPRHDQFRGLQLIEQSSLLCRTDAGLPGQIRGLDFAQTNQSQSRRSSRGRISRLDQNRIGILRAIHSGRIAQIEITRHRRLIRYDDIEVIAGCHGAAIGEREIHMIRGIDRKSVAITNQLAIWSRDLESGSRRGRLQLDLISAQLREFTESDTTDRSSTRTD